MYGIVKGTLDKTREAEILTEGIGSNPTREELRIILRDSEATEEGLLKARAVVGIVIDSDDQEFRADMSGSPEFLQMHHRCAKLLGTEYEPSWCRKKLQGAAKFAGNVFRSVRNFGRK